MKIYKMGDGPVYTFYRPYTSARWRRPDDRSRCPLRRRCTDAGRSPRRATLIALAKRDLGQARCWTGVGGFTCYGVIENKAVARRDDLLPMGLTEGCDVTRDVGKDEPLAFTDVTLPLGRLCDRLWHEQVERFPVF